MTYKGVKCEVCNNNFGEDDNIVVCPVCGTPHHRECWNGLGHCVNEQMHGSGYVWTAPSAQEEEKTRAQTMCSRCGAPIDPAAAICPNCGRPASGSVRPGEDIICPICGFVNEYGVDKCKKCSAPLFTEGTDEEFSFADDAFAADAKLNDIPNREYVEYIGRNRSRYLSSFYALSGQGRNISVNWGAMLFGPVWFFYRKMPKIGVLLIAAVFAFELLLGMIGLDEATKKYYRSIFELFPRIVSGEVGTSEANDRLTTLYNEYTASDRSRLSVASEWLESILTVSIHVFCGLFADRLYFRSVKRKILAARPKCTSLPEYYAYLNRKGGVSPGLAVAGAAILFAVSYAASFLQVLVAIM